MADFGRPKEKLSRSGTNKTFTPQKPNRNAAVYKADLNVVSAITGKKEVSGNHKCGICSKTPNDTAKHFYKSYSGCYKGYDYYLPICKSCLNILFNKLHNDIKDPHRAAKRICMMYDIYYTPKVVDTAMEIGSPNDKMGFYVSKMGLNCYANKTYADTIAEEEEEIRKIKSVSDFTGNPTEEEVPREVVSFWGFGFLPVEYQFLIDNYAGWTSQYSCKNKGEEAVFKNLCIIELQINKGIQKGDNVTQLYKQYNEFLATGNLQPKQSNTNTFVDQNTFATLIQKWENEKPISEPDPEWRDVDKIGYYISVWFLGHLCKMIGLKNKWAILYEEEIAKFTVDKPEFTDDEDEETGFKDIFGDCSDIVNNIDSDVSGIDDGIDDDINENGDDV